MFHIQMLVLLSASIRASAFNFGRCQPRMKLHSIGGVHTEGSAQRLTFQRIVPMVVLLLSNPSFALEDSKILFDNNCASCHPGGSNVVGYARGKTLRKEALEKYGFNNLDYVVNIIENGKGIMPRFSAGERFDGVLVPERLGHEEIQSVARYVLEEADQGWK